MRNRASRNLVVAIAAALAAAACDQSRSAAIPTPTPTPTPATTTPTTPSAAPTSPTGVDTALGGTGSDSIAIIGGGTADKLWIMDAKFHRNVTSIAGEGSDGRHLPRAAGPHQWNYPDLHDTHAVCTPKDFSKVYTANWFSYDESSYAIEFDPKTLKETRRVAIGKGGHHCALSPDDKFLYVANQYDTTVSVIDTATFQKVKDVDVGAMAVYPTPTMYWDGQAIDTPYIFVSATTAPPVDNATAAPDVPATNAVAVIDWKTNTVVKSIPIGTDIHGVNLTPDGKEVWVAEIGGDKNGTGDVAVIDVASLTITKRIKLGSGGIHIAFDRTNKYGFVTAGGNLYKVDRGTYAVVWSVPTEKIGAHLGVSPDNREVWTLNHGMNAERYPYLVGGMPPTGVQVFSTDDGHLVTEMVTEAVSHEIQFVPRSALGTPASTPPSGGTTDTSAGLKVYTANCAVCHGANGAGSMGAPALNSGKWLGNPDGVQAVVTTGTSMGMPAYGSVLSPADLKAVSDYVATLKP